MAATKRTPLDFRTIETLPTPPAASATVVAADKEERQQVGARVNKAVYRQLKARAAIEGVKVQDLVEQAIMAFLKA
jgi:predicted HicB family RNase H-like nuclease